MKITSLQMKNFRCFEDTTIDFHEQLTVLVGGNGSGKTAVLDAVVKVSKITIETGYYNQAKPFLDIAKNDIKKSKVEASIRYTFQRGEKLYYASCEDVHALNQTKSALSGSNVKIIQYYKSIRGLNVILSRFKADAVEDWNTNFKQALEWLERKESEEAKHALKIKDLDYRMPELQAVRTAIGQALGNYENPFTAETPPDFFIYKEGEPNTPYRISQLSDGYRTMLVLIMDLARRVAVANADTYAKEKKSVLESPAIVLIDEVELHLHPSWQQRVLPDLMRIFPNTQFIVTTHSPQVVSSVEPQHVRILKDGKVLPVETSTFGAESSRVLEEVFGVSVRPHNEAIRALDKYLKLINDGEGHSEEAKALRHKLDIWLADDPILDRADMFIIRNDRQTAREEKPRA